MGAGEGVGPLNQNMFLGSDGTIGGFLIELAEVGDTIEDPDTDTSETLTENSVIVHRRRGVMFMTAAMRAKVIEAMERENAGSAAVLDLRATRLPDAPWVVRQREREAKQAAANTFGRTAMDAAAERRALRNAKRLSAHPCDRPSRGGGEP